MKAMIAVVLELSLIVEPIIKINAFFTRFNYLFFLREVKGVFLLQKLWDYIGEYKKKWSLWKIMIT
jgi:hypothetical protein